MSEDQTISAQHLLLMFSPSAPQVMNAFYRRLFPYRPFFLWLNQDHGWYRFCRLTADH